MQQKKLKSNIIDMEKKYILIVKTIKLGTYL